MSDPADVPDLLVDELLGSQRLGLIGAASVMDHVQHSLGFASGLAAEPSRVADLGPGGGIPALVLAWRWPKSQWVLIEARERSVSRLEVMIARLGWSDRVLVRHGAAEDAGHLDELRHSFDLVTARGFGPPAMTAECAAPLLVEGGNLVVSEPPGASNRWAAEGMAALGFAAPRVDNGYMTACLERFCPPAVPRRRGLPRRRPLW